MPTPILDWLRSASLPAVAAVLLAENLVIFALALAVGALFVRVFAHRRVSPDPPPLERTEIVFATTTILLNSAVTVAGLALWRAGIVRFRDDLGPRAFADVLVLLLVMDAAMYALHRLAHWPFFYALLHRPHHRYDRPRPLTLFVLSPPETLAFGCLWLAVITLYPPSWLGMSLYLALNVAFGTIGHLGVEPFPTWKWIANAGFHARHHADPRVNLGFYTTVWDRLFGTLAEPSTKTTTAAR